MAGQNDGGLVSFRNPKNRRRKGIHVFKKANKHFMKATFHDIATIVLKP
jgi:hypothetical protein